MNIILTVFFEEPFWVGIFERYDDDFLQTSRLVFGSEPKDYEVYAFILNNYCRIQFGKPIVACKEMIQKSNPKRLQREIKNQTMEKGISTKAQRAVQEALEARKEEGEKIRKEVRIKQEKTRFALKQERKKEKKKGH